MAALVACLLLAAACSSSGSGEDRASPAGTGDAEPFAGAAPASALPDPALEARDCDPEVAEGVTYDCWWLVVPANRTDYDGTDLRLEVTVLHSTGDDPSPDPVIYLSGGPGYPGGSARYWSATPLIEERDVIVWDQRGTGDSEPDLECPEMEEAVLAGFADDAPYEEEQLAVRRAVEACHARLTDAGIDLRGFSTVESAADLADLRVALGYDEWNLFGISYGTRLAQETMRSHPEGIRSVILDSTYPMDDASITAVVEGGQRAFDQLAAGCAADPACAAAHGDLAEELDELVATFDAEPYRSRIDLGPDDGGEIDVAITGSDIVAGLFNAMYDTQLIPALPGFATALLAGETGLVDLVAADGIPFVNRVAEGQALSVNCADGGPAFDATAEEDAALLADPGKWASLLTVFTPTFCEEWTYAEVDERFLDPVDSDLPTLVLSGTYDPVTPTPGADAVVSELGDVTFVTFDGVGHGAWDATECGTGITLAFLADPGAELDTSCADAVGPPDFN